MPYPKKYWSLDTVDDIVRTPSTTARERKEWWDEKKAGGCELCGAKDRLAFHHKDPADLEFNVQSAGLRTPTSTIEAELLKCICICVACRQKVLGGKRPTSRQKNKQLYWDLQKLWYVPPAPLPTPKRSKIKPRKR